MPKDGRTAGRLSRRFLLGSGPLKRGSDRVQVAARVLLLTLLLMAAPIAMAVATVTGSQTRSLANSQAADRRQVGATVVEDAPPAGGGDDAGARTAVPVVWTAPSGTQREGSAYVSAQAKVGDTVTIWVDGSGGVTSRPLGTAAVVARAVAFGVTTFLGLSTLATAGYIGVCQLLDRNRLRRWAAEWAAVEPVWSRKVP